MPRSVSKASNAQPERYTFISRYLYVAAVRHRRQQHYCSRITCCLTDNTTAPVGLTMHMISVQPTNTNSGCCQSMQAWHHAMRKEDVRAQHSKLLADMSCHGLCRAGDNQRNNCRRPQQLPKESCRAHQAVKISLPGQGNHTKTQCSQLGHAAVCVQALLSVLLHL